ncbi:T9SS type A sorting domain-containing protein [Lewinella sp. IMCC34191]|uniref:T9SS type A sorting domain-containing protein n=1 Tax=Lewinella sp. IMCC34191 TaxID=2259172 RepID=UPI000E23AC91|nr:T9SS type A sorting domain-containing protein [Lewinella sp. IMCC34191]
MKTISTRLVTCALILVFLPLSVLRATGGEPPVVVTALYGEYLEGSGIVLYWRTPAENAEGQFEILRSTDGDSFDLIGRVEDPAAVATEAGYRFRDSDVEPGTYHYRLRQVDDFGRTSISRPITLDVAPTVATNIYAYPDAQSNIATIGLNSSWAGETVAVEVTSRNGQPISLFDYAVNDRIRVPLENLPVGTYTVRISAKQRTITRHVIIR